MRARLTALGTLLSTTLAISLEKAKSDCSESAAKPDEDELYRLVAPLLSVTLFLCSMNDEIRPFDEQMPKNPLPKHTKHGDRYFPADKPRQWDVAFRLGAALKQAAAQVSTSSVGEGEGSRAPMRPHLRRAHWHHFWRGKRNAPEQREAVAKWLPPIPVNVASPDDRVTTIHPVNPPCQD